MTDETPEEILPIEVKVTNQPEIKEIKDNTSWEEEDPWAFTAMSEQDITEAEESRNA